MDSPSGSYIVNSKASNGNKWGFPEIRGTLLGVPIIRTTVFWVFILGAPYLGKLPNLGREISKIQPRNMLWSLLANVTENNRNVVS